MPRISAITTMAIRPKPPRNRPPPSGIGIPPPPKPPPPKPPPPKPPSPRRSSILLLSSPSICMTASPSSNYSGGDESDRRHLEHQFGPPADRQRRTLSQAPQARRALSAGDQVPRRILPAFGL